MQTQSNKLDFTGQKIFTSFDAHLKSWEVTIMTETLTHKTFSQPPRPDVLKDYLVRHFPGGTYYSAYEAGFCGYWIHHQLSALGINSIVVNPSDIPTTNKERVQKEDRRDSLKIARALRAGELTPIFVPSEKTLEDRALIRLRITLTRDLARYKNRIKSFLYFHGIDYPKEFEKSGSHWSKRFMAWLDSIEMREQSGRQSLRALTGEYMNLRKGLLVVVLHIRALSRTEPYSVLVELLQRLPGIGLITAMVILTELETVSRFRDLDHLCGLVGLVPSTHSSGEKEKTGDITPRAHSTLRTALIESAWVAVRVDPELKKYFYGYCRRMTPNRAIIRIAKRLLGMIHFVLKNKRPYVSKISC